MSFCLFLLTYGMIMNVLIACEASQTVCKAFRAKGHNAYSSDLIDCYGGHPEWHIKGDCLKLINGRVSFITQDGKLHEEINNRPWDMIIAHPPCTYLSKAGACNTFDFYGQIKNPKRIEEGQVAREFFLKFFSADCERICIENPVPLKIFKLPIWSQIIQPYYFGDPFTKATCLWLIGLPELQATNILTGTEILSWTKVHSSQKIRSKTFNGIAEAMAEQWYEGVLPYQLQISI